MADQEGRFEGVEEVAERLLVDPQTVRRWIKFGKLKAYKPGREYRIKSTDLEEFLNTREVGPKGQAPSRSLEDVLTGHLTRGGMQERVAALDIVEARALLDELAAEQERLLPLLPQPKATWTTQDRENFHRFAWINRGMAVVLEQLASEIEALA